MKSWNAIELEIIRLTSSYCEYRLVRSITAFWRLRLFLPRERQSSKLFHKLILTLLRSITDVINAYIFESCQRFNSSGCISIFFASMFCRCFYFLVRSRTKRLSFKRSFSNNIAEIGAMKNVINSFKPSEKPPMSPNAIQKLYRTRFYTCILLSIIKTCS